MTSEPRSGSASRARTAARAVRQRFGRRLLGLPGTHLPRVAAPAGPGRLGPWHYWWLAHYLDCLVDEADRERRAGDGGAARFAAALANRLLRTIRLRGGARFSNAYYDDMAWLLLAARRLDQLLESAPDLAAPSSLPAEACRELTAALHRGLRPEGGVYWNRRHDFVALAATGPAAIAWARGGERSRAGGLVDWAYATLHDEGRGLFADGVRRGPDGRWALVPDVYTYNQGTVLGALVELGDPTSVRRAAALVDAVGRHLAPGGVLTSHGGHDGGLFTGIAARYLALAARSPALPERTRQRAAGLVRRTADALWQGRVEHPQRAGPVVFSPEPARPAAGASPAGRPVELSTQLQAWLLFEAADTLGDGPR